MKFLVTFLVIVAAAFLLAGLIPVLTVGLALLVCFGGFFVWLLPILIIACSDKTTGGEKAAWILAIIFLSWFAWIFYFLLAPVSRRDDFHERRYYRDRDYRY